MILIEFSHLSYIRADMWKILSLPILCLFIVLSSFFTTLFTILPFFSMHSHVTRVNGYNVNISLMGHLQVNVEKLRK